MQKAVPHCCGRFKSAMNILCLNLVFILQIKSFEEEDVYIYVYIYWDRLIGFIKVYMDRLQIMYFSSKIN